MRRPVPTILLLLCGTGLLRIALFTDLYLRYVKEGMRPLLIASGVLLVLLGAADAVSYVRRRGNGAPADRGDQSGPGERGDQEGHSDQEGHGGHGHGHPHSGAPRAAWLLFLPVLSLVLWAPPALGAYTASRQPPRAVTQQSAFDPLPAASPLPLTLWDFIRRVQQDPTRAIEGRTVRMTGFATPGKRGGGWFLNRIMISCCAADAQSVRVRIFGAPAPAAGTWVTVTGTWHSGGALGTASASVALDARSVHRVAKPANAYTDALPLTPSR
ncbi:TIGR03943 family protein [Streptomyces sp. NPDC006193]|uniref:TIGR03943 family putative permease subunit n=1 Tax=Streptomyces sp. NPDC006193 TaxID=3155717 RepID=UPI0033A6EACA